MKCVIYGRESVEELKKLAYHHFQPVPDRDLEYPQLRGSRARV
jgi:secreted Zn-dependent insulinase-like peptidase